MKHPWMLNVMLLLAATINMGTAAFSISRNWGIIVAAGIAVTCVAFFFGWLARVSYNMRGDWEQREAIRDANILIGRLALDLVQCGPNGDILKVYRDNKLAMDKLEEGFAPDLTARDLRRHWYPRIMRTNLI